uniref:Uncharacterized protein n=1 Tax=Triticum urartu TaxID=4572 RepID=A0A8R7QZD9_TRIUA
MVSLSTIHKLPRYLWVIDLLHSMETGSITLLDWNQWPDYRSHKLLICLLLRYQVKILVQYACPAPEVFG